MTPLILVILTSTAILISFRVFERFNIHILQAIIWNYLVAATLGFFLSKETPNLQVIISKPWAVYAIIIGLFFIVVFNLFGHSSQKIGIAVTAVASKMSVVIPITIGILLYGESPGALKITGILLAITAFWFTLGGGAIRGSSKKLYWYLPLLLFFGNGINDSLMKHVETSFLTGSSMLLISCVFTVSLFLGILFSIVSYKRNPVKWELKNFVAGLVLGLLNLSSTYYFFESIAIYPNTVFFPVFNVSVVALSAIVGVVLFKEALSPRKRLGIIFSLIAIVLITFSK